MQNNNSSFLKSNMFPAMLLSEKGEIIDINDKFSKLYMIPENEIIHKPLLEVFEIETPNNENFVVENLSESQVVASFVVQKYNKIPLQLVFSDIDDSKLITVIVTKKESDHFNNDTFDSLNQLNFAVECANIGIWQYDIDKRQVLFSPKFRQLINLPKPINVLSLEEFIDLLYPDDKETFTAFFKYHLNNGISLDFEFRILIDGGVRWFRIQGNLFYQQQLKYRIMGTLVDITEFKEALDRLNQGVISNKIAMEVGKVGSWHAKLDHEKQWQWSWDELTNNMFGLQPGDIGDINKWQRSLHPDDYDDVISTLLHSFKTGEDFIKQYRAILPNGDVRYFAGKGKVGQNNNGESCRIDGVCIDETAIRLIQNQLKKLNNELEASVEKRTKELKQSTEQAERASQTKSDFLSMMSHELRTPMNAVIGSLDLLTTTEQTVEAMDLIDTAKTSSENLVCILNDILDISKIEAGKLLLEERAFSLSEVIDNIVKVFVPTAQKQDVLFEVYEDVDIPLYVKGDSMRVRQILFNIIGNALKFTSTSKDKQGVVKLHAQVIENNPYISTISFKIIDNGIGIDRDVQQKLFTPFIQAERSTTRKFGGTGLGLAICGQLTEMMGGRITLTSKIGEGSCFNVELPFWLSQETSALDVELLSAMNVCLVCSTEELASKQAICEQYIASSGAIVSKYNLSDSNLEESLAECDFQVLIFLVDHVEDNQNQLAQLIEQLNKKQILIAVRTLDIPLAKKVFKGVRIINLETLTKVQFIDLIKKTKESSCDFDFDFDLDDLNLAPDESDMELDELDMDLEGLDLSELEKPKKVENNKSTKQLKEGILVVEDNPLNQKLIKQQLTKLGYCCDLANDGVEGRDVWQGGDYKMILTDCHMPKMDGYQMAQAIRTIESEQEKNRIPIIAVTGAAMSGDDEKCFQAGMSDFVSKPVQLADLRKVLERWYTDE